MILDQDTLYFRHDHPNGFLFSAGNEAPAAGWYVAPEDIPEEAAPSYECTTMAAYAELVRTERQGVLKLIADLRLAMQRLAVATGVIAALQNDNTRLTEQIAELQPAPEGA